MINEKNAINQYSKVNLIEVLFGEKNLFVTTQLQNKETTSPKTKKVHENETVIIYELDSCTSNVVTIKVNVDFPTFYL